MYARAAAALGDEESRVALKADVTAFGNWKAFGAKATMGEQLGRKQQDMTGKMKSHRGTYIGRKDMRAGRKDKRGQRSERRGCRSRKIRGSRSRKKRGCSYSAGGH